MTLTSVMAVTTYIADERSLSVHPGLPGRNLSVQGIAR